MKKKFILLIPLLVLLVTCSGKRAQETEVLINLSNITGISFAGGTYVWAKNSDSGKLIKADLSSENTVLIPHGSWDFSFVGYLGPGFWQGTESCGSSGILDLKSAEASFDISMSITDCALMQIYQDMIAEKAGATSSIDTSSLGAAPADEEWIVVPANAGGMGLDAFAVMKYEAKAFNDVNMDSTIDSGEVDPNGQGVAKGTHVPVSTAENQPWRSINANDSAAECESLGANYHLISNPEWMAIAREVEMQDANWTGGTEGTGCLFRGNSGDTTCGYDAVTDPDSGPTRHARAKHVLSNAEEIYDLAGNLWEWTDWDENTAGFQTGPTTCSNGWQQLTGVSCTALADAEYNTDNGSYTSTKGVGKFYGGSGGATLRGGNSSLAAVTGAFALSFNVSIWSSSTSNGFRCVFRP